jgi:hypothetical protein
VAPTPKGDASQPTPAGSEAAGAAPGADASGRTAATQESAAAPAPAKPLIPADRPPPKGQAAAVKLYSARKFDQATKMFQQFIKDGVADVNTHAYLAYCLYSMRQYHQALKQYDWVAKYGIHTVTLQNSAESSARMLRCHMNGICPMNCLKPNDPRWRHVDVAGNPSNDIWAVFPVSGGRKAFSDHHMGDLIVYENGDWVDKGKCPVCGGSGQVPILKDGDPNPQ